jgi:hypothetical protein
VGRDEPGARAGPRGEGGEGEEKGGRIGAAREGHDDAVAVAEQALPADGGGDGRLEGVERGAGGWAAGHGGIL